MQISGAAERLNLIRWPIEFMTGFSIAQERKQFCFKSENGREGEKIPKKTLEKVKEGEELRNKARNS